jgi:hypothetical protein
MTALPVSIAASSWALGRGQLSGRQGLNTVEVTAARADLGQIRHSCSIIKLGLLILLKLLSLGFMATRSLSSFLCDILNIVRCCGSFLIHKHTKHCKHFKCIILKNLE